VPARAGRDEIRGLAELSASRSTHAALRGQAHWTQLPRFMMHGMLWCGNERVSYLLAAVAATGFLGGAGLFVVLADAGQREEQGTSRPAAAASGEVEEVVRSSVGTGPGRKKKVVVLGTGWAGTSFLKNLDSSLYDVIVVAPRNCFVFTPLLPSVASGVVEARSVTEPIRRIIRKRNIEFYQSECVRIDAKSKQILCNNVSERKSQGKDVEFSLDYDLLVVAVGATNNTFGTKGVQEYCHFLKEIEDAEKIRESVVERFETASLPNFSSEDRYAIKIRLRNLSVFVFFLFSKFRTAATKQIPELQMEFLEKNCTKVAILREKNGDRQNKVGSKTILLSSCLTCSQIWLIPLLDDRHTSPT